MESKISAFSGLLVNVFTDPLVGYFRDRYIFGQPVEVGRVNYVLRAISVKPGNHKVELSFFPKSVDTTETIAYTAYAVLALVVVVLVLLEWRRRKNGDAKEQV